ncbi:MAG: glycosyltransferase [Anaerolineae bacterium]|nr:glycosyltransferase [Anaerolineae bacterium]
MDVLHVMTSLNPGGVATFIRHLVPRLSQQGIHSEIVLTIDRGIIADVLTEQEITIHTCWKELKYYPEWSWRVGKAFRTLSGYSFPLRLKKIIQQRRPDIVHSHMHGELWTEQLRSAHAAGAPMALTLHSPSSIYPQLKALKKFIRQLQPGDMLVGLGPGVYRAYGPYFPDISSEYLYNLPVGIPYGLPDTGAQDQKARSNIHTELGIPTNTPVVGSIGRLLDVKRYGDLLTAIPEIPDTHVLLVGDGTDRQNLETQAAALNIENRVHFVGFQTNPEYWLDAIDIYVLPSQSEGLPVAILEAMAKGIPTVATRVRGITDLVEHEKNGLLVPLADPPALAAAIRLLLDDSALRARLGHQARSQFLAHYLIDHVAELYGNLYHLMLDNWNLNHQPHNA